MYGAVRRKAQTLGLGPTPLLSILKMSTVYYCAPIDHGGLIITSIIDKAALSMSRLAVSFPATLSSAC